MATPTPMTMEEFRSLAVEFKPLPNVTIYVHDLDDCAQLTNLFARLLETDDPWRGVEGPIVRSFVPKDVALFKTDPPAGADLFDFPTIQLLKIPEAVKRRIQWRNGA
jgi:hypothetical protein